MDSPWVPLFGNGSEKANLITLPEGCEALLPATEHQEGAEVRLDVPRRRVHAAVPSVLEPSVVRDVIGVFDLETHAVDAIAGGLILEKSVYVLDLVFGRAVPLTAVFVRGVEAECTNLLGAFIVGQGIAEDREGRGGGDQGLQNSEFSHCFVLSFFNLLRRILRLYCRLRRLWIPNIRRPLSGCRSGRP